MNLTIILSSTTDISEEIRKVSKCEPIYIHCDYGDISIFAQNLIVSPYFRIENSIIKKSLSMKTLDITGHISGYNQTFKDIMLFERDVIGLTTNNEVLSLTNSRILMINIESLAIGDQFIAYYTFGQIEIIGAFPYLKQFKIKVSSIECGAQHIIINSIDGVFTWGNNSEGQLGKGNLIDSHEPYRLSTQVDQIAAGKTCSYYLLQNQVYFCGSNINMQRCLTPLLIGHALRIYCTWNRFNEISYIHTIDYSTSIFTKFDNILRQWDETDQVELLLSARIPEEQKKKKLADRLPIRKLKFI